jgi:hypothetical protein
MNNRPLGRPIVAPLGVVRGAARIDLTTVRELAATVEPCVCATGT